MGFPGAPTNPGEQRLLLRLDELFDVLTWFEFAAEHETAFDDLLARLRASAEWTYVEREVDIRLVRA